MKFTPNLTKSEWKQGLIAMIVCMAIIPALLSVVLADRLTPGQLNFLVYFLSAAVAVYVLRRFLLQNLRAALERPFLTIYYAVLGYLAHTVLSELAAVLIFLADPGFVNLNDQNISAQLGADLRMMAVTTILLAPIAEECLFRGLLFRGIYDRSPAGAWILSIFLFAAVHISGYIGVYTPLQLVLSLIQYLPAGIVLCFTYQRGGSILSPILTHAIVNAVAVLSVVR